MAVARKLITVTDIPDTDTLPITATQLNPKTFKGAVGDGVTNDASAIQDTIDDAESRDGGVVMLPPGDFYTGTTTLKLTKNVILSGSTGIGGDGISTTQANRGATRIVYEGGGYAIDIGDGSTFSGRGGIVQNLYLFGNSLGSNGIRLFGAAGGSSAGSLLRNLTIVGFTGTGVELTQRCWSNVLRDVHIASCDIGIDAKQEANAIYMYNVDINTCTTHGVLLGAGSGTIQSNITAFGLRVQNCGTGYEAKAPTKFACINGAYFEGNTNDIILSGVAAQNLFDVHMDHGANAAITISASCVLTAHGIDFSGGAGATESILHSAGTLHGSILGVRQAGAVAAASTLDSTGGTFNVAYLGPDGKFGFHKVPTSDFHIPTIISDNTSAGTTNTGAAFTCAGNPAFRHIDGSANVLAEFNINNSEELFRILKADTSPVFRVDAENLRVGIGTAAPASSAILDLTSTTQGLLLPRMTTAQRDAIATPQNGLLIYNTTTTAVNAYENGSWVDL